MRVVSLLPGATELLAAMGVDPVGVSHECDHPPRMADVPAVTECRVDTAGSPTEVNEAVGEAAAEGGVYEVDRDRLAALDPDLVVTQAVCDVCAVDSVLAREAIADLGLDADLLTLDVHSLPDLYDAVDRLGDALEGPDVARRLRSTLSECVAAVEERTPPPESGPRVAVLDWPEPPMVAGHWVPDLVERAGGRYGLADTGDRSEPRQWATIRDYDPDVLVVAPCGFDLEQTRDHVDALTEREGWESLSAVASGRTYLMDGHHYVNRAGPRLVDTGEILADVLHGDTESSPADVVRPLRAGRPASGR